MDTEKKTAFAKATKKLLETKTPEEDILISLGEMGLSEEEARETLGFAKTLSMEKKTSGPEKAKEEKKEKPKTGFWGSEEEGILEKREEKTAPQKGETEEQPPKKWGARETHAQSRKTGFIPELRKGGREKVTEIMAESPLDAGKKDEKTLEQTKKLEKLTEGKTGKEKEAEKTLQETGAPAAGKKIAEEPQKITEQGKTRGEEPETAPEPGTGAEKEKTAQPPREKTESGLTGFDFNSSLDMIEKEVEHGKPLEEAAKKIEKKHTEREKASSNISILIIPNREYSKGISALLRKTSENYERIALVNLNELYKNMISHLRELKVDINNFFFIDAITITSDKNVKKHDNVIFVSSPNSLIELSLAITQALNTQKPDVLVFDSLSTLLIYENESTVTKFVHSLIGKIKAYGLDAYFTALEGDADNDSIKDLSMFVDRVNTLTEFELGEFGFESSGKVPSRMTPLEVGAKKGAKPREMSPELLEHIKQNAIVTQEMNRLKQKLEDMQEKSEVAKSLEELRGEMGKIGELGSLREQVKKISEKIGKRQEPRIDKSVIGQIARLEKKIDESGRRTKSRENEKYREEIKETVNSLREKMEKIERLSTLQEQVKRLSKKVEKKKEQPVDNNVVDQITRLAEKIEGLEKKVSRRLREKKSQKEKETLKKKLEAYKKQAELQAMMNDFYKTDISKVNPEKVMTRHLEKELRKKEGFLEKAYGRGLVPKKIYSKGKNRIRQETKRLKHAAMVHSLEGKLNALNEAFDSGVISRDSYAKGKARIERLLKT